MMTEYKIACPYCKSVSTYNYKAFTLKTLVIVPCHSCEKPFIMRIWNEPKCEALKIEGIKN